MIVGSQPAAQDRRKSVLHGMGWDEVGCFSIMASSVPWSIVRHDDGCVSRLCTDR